MAQRVHFSRREQVQGHRVRPRRVPPVLQEGSVQRDHPGRGLFIRPPRGHPHRLRRGGAGRDQARPGQGHDGPELAGVLDRGHPGIASSEQGAVPSLARLRRRAPQLRLLPAVCGELHLQADEGGRPACPRGRRLHPDPPVGKQRGDPGGEEPLSRPQELHRCLRPGGPPHSEGDFCPRHSHR